jgi:hypothetical protein
MPRPFTRRHLLKFAPVAALASLSACSKAPEPAATAAAPPAPPPPPPAAPAVEAPPVVAATPATAPLPASGDALTMLDEKDVQAAALGYAADGARVDRERFKAYVPGHQCDGCAQYSGKAGETAGPCAIFQGKRVAAGGWCSAWIKKA